MDPDSQEFDYEGLLEKYSNQDDTHAITEEKSQLLDETYKELIEKHQSVLKAYNKKKRNKAKSRASVAKQLNIQVCYNDALTNQQTKLRKLQQEITFSMNDDSQIILLDDMKQLSTEYESLNSEFDNETLQEKTIQLQKDIQPIIEEQRKYENILKFARKAAEKLELVPEMFDTTVLLPLSESISNETTQNFGPCAVLEHGKIKLATALQNHETLKRNVMELGLQLQ